MGNFLILTNEIRVFPKKRCLTAICFSLSTSSKVFAICFAQLYEKALQKGGMADSQTSATSADTISDEESESISELKSFKQAAEVCPPSSCSTFFYHISGNLFIVTGKFNTLKFKFGTRSANKGQKSSSLSAYERQIFFLFSFFLLFLLPGILFVFCLLSLVFAVLHKTSYLYDFNRFLST